MNRFWRINTIWRKELADTLRDRRTVVAMVLVPMVLYPALMLGSLQAFELQTTQLKQEEYTVGVDDQDTHDWLRHVIDTDLARRPGARGGPAEDLEQRVAEAEARQDGKRRGPPGEAVQDDVGARARVTVYDSPPDIRVKLVSDIPAAIQSEEIHLGLQLAGGIPGATDKPVQLAIIADETDFRGRIAQTAMSGIIDRLNRRLVEENLEKAGLPVTTIQPIELATINIASAERQSASVIGQIVPLILIIMTITGAIYPAIDLTAGERERGTLETLMVAPVPSVDLIAGKFVVVAMIGMLSALLNLLSIGGTIYLGGLGKMLAPGGGIAIPIHVLPWVLLLLVPLAIMFSALLLAVCSFARSFKEAQNYIMPVMVAAMIPAIVGILPGIRLTAPILVMPVTNIVILTRDLFLGDVNFWHIGWVFGSTSIYAAAAVSIAARLFGQEAVLFSDTASMKTIFIRKFFKPSDTPSAAQAFLLMALLFSLNYFLQIGLSKGTEINATFLSGTATILILLFAGLPLATALYMKVRIASGFHLEFPRFTGILAGVCFGLSTWVLGFWISELVQHWLPMPPEFAARAAALNAQLLQVNPYMILFCLAVVPAFCEEFFFRGFALSGLRSELGAAIAILVTAVGFAVSHGSVIRIPFTFAMGLVLALLVIRFRSIWPAMIAHLLHNGITTAVVHEELLRPTAESLGFLIAGESPLPPLAWRMTAIAIAGIGLLLTFLAGKHTDAHPRAQAPHGTSHTTPEAAEPS